MGYSLILLKNKDVYCLEKGLYLLVHFSLKEQFDLFT